MLKTVVIHWLDLGMAWKLAVLAVLLVTHAVAALPGPPQCSAATLNKVAFGVGSSATQIGGAAAGGRSPSVWDKFAAESGKIQDGSSPATATDFYNKYKQDIQLMKTLGVKNFRMSLSWSRLIPRGLKGSAVSEDGVRFYNNVITELKKNGIEPAITLYHWDLPQVLQDKYQGFMDRQFVDDFVYYAKVAFEKFGGRVRKWTTFNEPWVICNNQYGSGDFAPGIAFGDSGKYKCGHNLLLAHAYAVKLYRGSFQGKKGGKIGMALWSEWSEPFTSSEGDKRAAQNKMTIDFGWFADPIHFGDYPQQVKDRQSPPTFTDYEKSILKKSYDYMGLTIYTAKYAKEVPGNPYGWWVSTTDVNGKAVGEQAESYWLYNVPWSINKMLNYMRDRYNNPYIWVLENGISEKGEVSRQGNAALQDSLRVDYFKGYIEEACKAINNGVRLTHYFAWSLTDNWEWREGFTTRFGIVRIDFDKPGLPRRIKDSAKWLSQYIFKVSHAKRV
eukprot:GHRR01007582.1.p1 GENE.GHRR01007582.1~~GHRR01007582.1.p1  ORF type:complete len:500 (+),score=122.40 GHRR01007582.1:150-1649(+)